MTDTPMLTEAQMQRIASYFPRSRGRPRVDDRRVLSGIVLVIRNGLRWRDAPAVYGPPKTLTTAESSGAASACSRAFSRGSQRKRGRPSSL